MTMMVDPPAVYTLATGTTQTNGPAAPLEAARQAQARWGMARFLRNVTPVAMQFGWRPT